MSKPDSEEEEDYSSGGSGSPVDDLAKDPSYKGSGTAEPTTRKTRHTTSLPPVYPNGKGKKATMVNTPPNEGSGESGGLLGPQGGPSGQGGPPGQLAALMAMKDSFYAMTDQAKQNNKTFLNDLPFF